MLWQLTFWEDVALFGLLGWWDVLRRNIRPPLVVLLFCSSFNFKSNASRFVIVSRNVFISSYPSSINCAAPVSATAFWVSPVAPFSFLKALFGERPPISIISSVMTTRLPLKAPSVIPLGRFRSSSSYYYCSISPRMHMELSSATYWKSVVASATGAWLFTASSSYTSSSLRISFLLKRGSPPHPPLYFTLTGCLSFPEKLLSINLTSWRAASS